MKKKYLPKIKKLIDPVRGAFDKSGNWWHERDIESFTGSLVKSSFGKEREHIEIITIERKNIKTKP